MTQDEVDLIYDYLHEHYEYKDGELIRKVNLRNRKKGDVLGSVNTSERRGRLKIQCSIFVHKKTYSMQLQHLVWLFHYKKKAKYLRKKDQNPMNHRIENLEECTLSQTHHPDNYNRKRQGYFILKKNGVIRYRAIVQPRGQVISLDSYDSPEEAYEAHCHAKKLFITGIYSAKEIIRLTHEKYPGYIHKYANDRELPKGVYKNINTYYSKIMKNGKVVHLGKYSTPEEAHKAYLKAKAENKSS